MDHKTGIVLIGGSAGSISILLEVIPALREDISFPIVIIIHRKNSIGSVLSNILNSKTLLEVVDAEEKDVLTKGKIYIAPSDYHLLIENDHSLSLDFSEKVKYSRPSIDITFYSAAEIFKEKTVAILLSGANSDGVDGLNWIKKYNGTTIVQNPDTAEFKYMPLQAINHSIVDKILNPYEMAEFINKLND